MLAEDWVTQIADDTAGKYDEFELVLKGFYGDLDSKLADWYEAVLRRSAIQRAHFENKVTDLFQINRPQQYVEDKVVYEDDADFHAAFNYDYKPEPADNPYNYGFAGENDPFSTDFLGDLA